MDFFDAADDFLLNQFVSLFFLSAFLMVYSSLLRYLEKTPQLWHPNHSVVVKEIENVNKLKMALFCNHTMNFQEFGEKNKRRTELVIEIKKIFEELNIKYYLLPQQVHLSHIGSEARNLQFWTTDVYPQVTRYIIFPVCLPLRSKDVQHNCFIQYHFSTQIFKFSIIYIFSECLTW